ncbi:MAG: phosphatase [bacterium]|nr:phosphatase [bacterium]
MKDVIDLHTHTIASGHAYCTMLEMARAGADKNLEMLAITEHGPSMRGTCTDMYFQNLKVAPRERFGITVLYGVELNIMDTDGTVDLPNELLPAMDVCIASMHIPCYAPRSLEENTSACINAMKNPYVNVLGHPDDPRYPIDLRAIVEAAKENHVMLEMNNSSLAPTSFRKATEEGYLKFLELCKEYDQPVLMGSDAHIDIDVGNHRYVAPIIEKADFPEHLIMNSSVERIKPYLNYYKR